MVKNLDIYGNKSTEFIRFKREKKNTNDKKVFNVRAG